MASFQFLGTGASAGIPVIGCKCDICHSTSACNKRMRPAGLLRVDGKKILIDVGPDFRQQALQFGIDHVDGLLLTHTHSDHIAGVDDLRIFFVRGHKPVPCLLSQESAQELCKRYDYLFAQPKDKASLTAQLELHILKHNMGHTEFLGLRIGYCSFYQSSMQVTGWKIGRFAYISDIREYEISIFDALQGTDLLVLSALRKEASPLHLTLDEAVVFARRVGAKKTYLTHISHTLEHESTNRFLPPDVQLGYDGQQLEFSL
ncbi:MAG: MBL fold metallo-hydrolase [Chlamydiia bacterium]|nr:MBL fold metallo-hydrolase [Chlamydiia bacterium]